jgi:hypothetical protein
LSPEGIVVQESSTPVVEVLSSSIALPPQLVVRVFDVSEPSQTVSCKLVTGNLRIRTPRSGTTSSITTRIRIFQEALEIVQRLAEQIDVSEHNGGFSGASQPAVIIMVGDPNISAVQGEEALQSLQPTSLDANWRATWRVRASMREHGGDILFAKGTHAAFLDMPIGGSYADRSMRSDSRDAFGVTITMPWQRQAKLDANARDEALQTPRGQNLITPRRKLATP